MTDSDKELENQILEAGEKLTDPPSSLDELLLLLDVSPPLLSLLCSSSSSPRLRAKCYVFCVDFSIIDFSLRIFWLHRIYPLTPMVFRSLLSLISL